MSCVRLRSADNAWLVSLAMLGAAAAHAQSSITIYGRLDASVNSLRFRGASAARGWSAR